MFINELEPILHELDGKNFEVSLAGDYKSPTNYRTGKLLWLDYPVLVQH